MLRFKSPELIFNFKFRWKLFPEGRPLSPGEVIRINYSTSSISSILHGTLVQWSTILQTSYILKVSWSISIRNYYIYPNDDPGYWVLGIYPGPGVLCGVLCTLLINSDLRYVRDHKSYHQYLFCSDIEHKISQTIQGPSFWCVTSIIWKF